MPAFSLIVGLGNPGRQYEGTRHNVGFRVLDLLASSERTSFHNEPKWQCHVTKLPGSGTLLAKPQTFMNLSGRAVRQIMAFHKWTTDHLLVVYDDAALDLGTLRFREKGSAGGHNGVSSIIEHLGSEAFARLKIGIGGSPPGEMTGHVLGRFHPDELGLLENTLATARDAVQFALSQGVARAANLYHTRSQLQQTKPDEPEIREPDRPEH